MSEQTRISIGPVRVAFCKNVIEPGKRDNGSDVYGLTFLLDKNKPEHQQIRAELLKLASAAIVERWPDKDTRPAKLKTPIKDGDSGEDTNDGVPKSKKFPAFAGHWYVDVSSNYQPGVVDQQVRNLSDVDAKKALYPGVWVNLQVHAYAYAEKKFGASIGLDNIQIDHNDEPLGGGGAPDPREAFKPLAGASAFGDAHEGAAGSSDDPDSIFS